jgi:hypothetical protein
VAETEQEKQWRRELEANGETVVRDSMNHGGSLATGGEERRQHALRWLREKERERERDLLLTLKIAIATFIVRVLTFFAAVAAVVMPYFVRR